MAEIELDQRALAVAKECRGIATTEEIIRAYLAATRPVSDEAVEDVAARLWKAEAEDAGAPASVARGRTPEVFREQSEDLKARWRKFARTALAYAGKPTVKTRKIYLASRYSRAAELRGYCAELESLGFAVTSRWIEGGHELTKEGSTEAAQKERTRFAQEDWADMQAADCVISFTEEPRKTNTRGGRHVEFGGALAAGKRCMVVGWRENVFHCLPEVEFFESWDDCRSALQTGGETS